METIQKNITAIARTITSVAPVRKDLTPCSNGNDANVIVALKDRRINQVTDEELKQSVKYVMLLVGIRAKNLPVNEEKAVLLSYVRQYFELYTLQEFRLAFELAIAGELQLKDEDVKCFDNFSPQYVSRILKAYRKFAENVIEFSQRKYEEPEPIKPPENYVPAELVNTFYQEFLQGSFKPKLVSEIVYEAAFNHCNLKVDERDLLKIIEQAKEFVLNEYTMRLSSMNESKEEVRYAQLLQKKDKLKNMHIGIACKNDDVNHYAKALCLQFWFSEQKKKGIKNIV